MILPLAYYGDAVLRKKAVKVEKITDEIRQLVADMIDTMHAQNGIGLAAPQVHHSLNLFITEVPIQDKDVETGEVKWLTGTVRVFINPKIIEYSDEQWVNDEGCLSIPGLFGPVIRPVRLTVQAMDLEGKIFEEEFSWLDGRAVMHENDHINGVLFIDRIHGKERQAMDQELRAIKKKYQK